MLSKTVVSKVPAGVVIGVRFIIERIVQYIKQLTAYVKGDDKSQDALKSMVFTLNEIRVRVGLGQMKPTTDINTIAHATRETATALSGILRVHEAGGYAPLKKTTAALKALVSIAAFSLQFAAVVMAGGLTVRALRLLHGYMDSAEKLEKARKRRFNASL